VFLFLPLLLFFYMQRSMNLKQETFNWFDSTAIPHYHAMFCEGTRHWMVVMFYERVVLQLVRVVAIVLLPQLV
jgi:hypothetical protein